MHEAKTLAGLSVYRFFLSRMMESFKGWDTGIRITSVDGPGVRTMKIVSHGNVGISLAAYAAKAGRTCYMLRPEIRR
jgi:threonine synthase